MCNFEQWKSADYRAVYGLHNHTPPGCDTAVIAAWSRPRPRRRQGRSQAVEGFARLGLAELGRGTKGVVQQDADSHAGDHSLEESTRFHRVHLFFVAFLSFIGLCTVCPAEVKKCEKDGGVSCQAGAELV